MNLAKIKNISRILLGTQLIAAGISHLTFARKGFQAQVPNWVPLKKDDTVVYSGVVEILLGTAIVVAPVRLRKSIGLIAAGFFISVYPGNVAQYKNRADGLGLDTDEKRYIRLFFQPVLIIWALASTSRFSGQKSQKRKNFQVLDS